MRTLSNAPDADDDVLKSAPPVTETVQVTQDADVLKVGNWSVRQVCRLV